MNQDEIQTTLRTFIREQFPAARTDSFDIQDDLLTQGIVDSMGVLEIVTFIEQQFGVTLTDDELVSESFSSIHAMAEMVARKLPR